MSRKLLALLVLRLAAFAAIELGPVFGGALGPSAEPVCLSEQVSEDAQDSHSHQQALPLVDASLVVTVVSWPLHSRRSVAPAPIVLSALLRSRAPPVLG